MHRFYVPIIGQTGGSIELPPDQARQCARVLKLQPDERIALFDGTGRETILKLTSVSPRSVSGTVESERSPDRETRLALELLVALPRQEKWEWILQKGAELGVHHFQPLETARCVARISADDWTRKSERWTRVLVEASEQSGRVRISALSPPLKLNQILDQPPGIVLHTGPELPGLKESLDVHPARLRLMVGPEGGLEDSEVQALLGAGWTAAAMGPRTLRCETAAIAACVIALDHAGDLGPRDRP